MDLAQAATEAGNFAGFPPGALSFLRDLAANNDRAWFEPRKADYAALVLAPMRALVADMVAELARRRIPLSADPLKAVFRVHRDVRFSKDKSPYKTHCGAVLSPTGARDGAGGVLYLHLDPTGSFAAAGFYQPSPPMLEALRRAIVDEPDAFAAVLRPMQDLGADLRHEDALKRLPRGFESASGTPAADWVRQKHFVYQRALSPQDLAGPGLVATLGAFAEAAHPLLRFGWDAMAGAEAGR